MAYARARDGTRLYWEEAGEGVPVVFVHEFAGDWRSWELQVRALTRLKRCVTFSARGYPPSDIPDSADRYSQDTACGDVLAVMDHLGIGQAHIVGHSMGAYTTLHLGIRHPERCLSLTAAGCGWGSNPATRAQSIELATSVGRMFATEGIEAAARNYADQPMRQAHKAKDPRGWSEFAKQLAEHSAIGHSLTMLNVQLKRPTLWEMQPDLERLDVPLLVLVGDEDDACLDGSVLLKRIVRGAALSVLPRTGHTLQLEEPAAFNAALCDFFAAVESGRWRSGKTTAGRT